MSDWVTGNPLDRPQRTAIVLLASRSNTEGDRADLPQIFAESRWNKRTPVTLSAVHKKAQDGLVGSAMHAALACPEYCEDAPND